MNNKIKLILDESGQIKKASKFFNLYQNSVATVGLELYVPRQMLNAPMVADDNTVIGSNSVTIYAVATSETGKRITSPAEQCVFSHKEEFDGIEYWVFTRATGLPKEFLRYAGDLTICASICRIYTADDGSTKLEGRSKMQMFMTQVLPSPDSNLDPDFEASELTALYDLLNSTIIENEAIYGDKGRDGTIHANPAVNLSTLEDGKSNRTETVLKFDLKHDLPKHITYDKNGYKTVGVFYMNETFTIPTEIVPTVNLETVTGTLLVINIVPDIEQPGTIAWQNEIFYHEKGSTSRKIKLDISQYKETGKISKLEVGDWKSQNYAWFDTISQQITKLGNQIDGIENDYVSKNINQIPLNEKEEFVVTETGALQQTTTYRNICTGEKTTTTVTPVPVEEGKPRMFLPQEKRSLEELLNWKASLNGQALNYVVDLRDIPTEETESEVVQNYLTQKYKDVTATPDTILDQVTLHDEILGVAYRWYENIQQWVLSQGSLAGEATNNMYDEAGNLTKQGNVGGVVGSNKEGHILFETNGEGALVGYDALKQETLNNKQAVADEIKNRQQAIENESIARENADAAITAIIGVLNSLSTNQKDTLVNAINSLKTETNANAAAILNQTELLGTKADLTNGEQAITAKVITLDPSENDGNIHRAININGPHSSVSFGDGVLLSKFGTIYGGYSENSDGSSTPFLRMTAADDLEFIAGRISLGPRDSGEVHLKGNALVYNNMTIIGNETVQNDTTIRGNANVKKNLTVDNDVTISGKLYIS